MKLKNIERIKIDPKYLNQINNIDDELISYAIGFGYKYTDDIDDRLCENDYYVRTNIEKSKDFIKFFINSKHFNRNRFEDDIETRIKIINYALDNNLAENPVILSWIMTLKDYKDYYRRAGVFFITKDLLNNGSINFDDNIKQIYLMDNSIDSINFVINQVKKSNIDISFINVELPRKAYNHVEMNNLIDKDFVKFYTSSFEKISVEDIIKMNKLLDLFVSDIKLSELSPYEKYIAVYNIVKSFKKYKINEDNEYKDFIYSDESRSVYLVLNNLYMVCEGYSNLLEALLHRVGVNNFSFTSIKLNHALNYVNLVDEKYGIDGYYMCDVTNDNEVDMMMEKGYNNLHIITKEAKYLRNGEQNVDYIFDMNVEDIYNYINEVSNYDELMNIFLKLDIVFYNSIKNKTVNKNLAQEIYNYLQIKINKPIDNRVDIKAILEVKQFILGKRYSDEEYKSEFNKILEADPVSFKQLYIEKIYEKLKFMNINDYFEFKKSFNEKNIIYLEDALIKINDEFFELEEGISFLLDIYDENKSFKISLEEELDELSIKEIIDNLSNLGYKVKSINEELLIFEFLLDETYFDKPIINVYDDLKVIKSDFMKIYREMIHDLS